MAEQLPHELMSTSTARDFYELGNPNYSSEASPVDRQLLQQGIARIAMSLTETDFKQVTEGLDSCIDACPEVLAESFYIVDSRLNNSAGYVRKERKANIKGKQIDDPKSLVHFTETARERWQDQFKTAPKVLRSFLADGFAMQQILVSTARQHIEELQVTHPNLSRLYFPPEGPDSLSFMRVLSYDGYEVTGTYADVAKPHFDIGGVTIQAYADAPGFWGAKDGPRGERVHFDTAPDTSFLFLGTEHAKVYGDDSYLKPLWHGVDRVIPKDTTTIPNRHAVILFVDAPRVDYAITARDTQPHLFESSELPVIPPQNSLESNSQVA